MHPDQPQDTWGPLEIEPTTLIALWPGEKAPAMTRVLAAFGAFLNEDIRIVAEADTDDQRILWNVVVELPGGLGAGIVAVTAEGRGELPLDPTLGKALKTERARKTLAQHIDDGGVVGYVIVCLGIAALLLTLLKCIEILRFEVAAPEEVDGVLGELTQGNKDAAAQKAQQVSGVAGEMLTTGVEHAEESRGVLEELLFEEILRVRPALERFLPFLAITAAAAPLLGLL